MSKKCISFVLILIVMFNVFISNSYAEEMPVTTVPSQSTEEQPVIPSEDYDPHKQLEDMSTDFGLGETLNQTTNETNDGSVEVENDDPDKPKKVKLSTTGTTYTNPLTFKVLTKVIIVITESVNKMMTFVANISNDMNNIQSSVNTIKKVSKFTIFDMVMGNYEFFNIDFMDLPDDNATNRSGYQIFKLAMIDGYHMTRNLSIAISLFVLIYVGIRMAISTLAIDKAKYKKMFFNWVVSLLIIAVMDFIIIFISFVLNIALEIVRDLANALQINDIESSIYQLSMSSLGAGTTTSTTATVVAKGWNVATAVITLGILIYYELRFFIMYIHRVFEIGFLVAIGPIVTITYPIDKIGDNRAQAFMAWSSELIIKATVQVVHAVTYCVFIASAGVIAQNHPLLAAIFFSLLLRVEKIVRNSLSLKDDALHRAKIPFIGRHRKKH